MDTRIEFRINKRSYENSPIKTQRGYIDKSNVETVLFEFEEYEDVEITFNYDKSNGEIYIDAFDSVDKILCKPNQSITLNLRNNEKSLVPGYFEIKINNRNEDIYYYKVNPKNVEWDDLTSLRQLLNNYVQGLAVNFDLSKSSYNYKDNDTILDYYNNQYNLWEEIKLYINLILNNPDGKIEKVYGYYSKPNKLDKRSVEITNRDAHKMPSKYYTYNRHINYNTTDNIILYNSIEEYTNVLINNALNVEKIYEIENKKLKQMKIDYQNKQRELNYKKNNYHLSSRYKENIQSKVNYLKRTMYMQEKRMAKIKNLQEKIKEIQFETEAILFDMEEKLDLNKFNQKKVSSVKNLRYKNVIDLLNSILEAKEWNINSSNHKEALTFRFKKTELLFEYLCLIRVIEIILDMGYEFDFGWFENIVNQKSDIEIPPESSNYFKKDDITIVVSYDKEAPNIIDGDYEGLYSFNSMHRRPDISILIYKNDVFIKALILEVKCRNSKYIYSNQGETDVIVAMKDYSQLCYYKDKIKRDAIDKVITLYPKQENNISFSINELSEIFSFIAIDVSTDELDSELYVEVENFIDNNTNI